MVEEIGALTELYFATCVERWPANASILRKLRMTLRLRADKIETGEMASRNGIVNGIINGKMPL